MNKIKINWCTVTSTVIYVVFITALYLAYNDFSI